MSVCENGRWSSETNWDVIHGDLLKSITLETSSSPDEDEVITLINDPLILSPLSESGSCEITVKFRQQHEIHRIYLRSTARVYEIYYASDQNAENEYMCTVRCGPVDSAITIHLPNVPSATSNDEATKNNHSDEEGWVDVNITSSVLPNGVVPSLATQASRQVDDCTLYEATAEISDASPCTSVTVRLLSVQTKGYICIDELYILADPMEASRECEPANPAMSSANASFMAMLVPSLIQLSRASSKMQPKPSSDSKKPPNDSDIETLGSTPAEKPLEDGSDKIGNQNPSSESSLLTGECIKEGGDFIQIHSEKSGNTFCNCRCEAAVEKLAQKVERMFLQFARIEQNMLRPLMSIETKVKDLQTKLDDLQTQLDQRLGHESDDSSYDGYDDDDDDDDDDVDDDDTEESEEDLEFANELEQQNSVTSATGSVESTICLHYGSGNSTCSDNDHETKEGKVANGESRGYQNPGGDVRNDEESDTRKEKYEFSPDSGDAFGAVSTKTSKPRPSIDDALASALSAFISASPTPLTVTSNEQNNLFSVNCDKEEEDKVQTETSSSIQSQRHLKLSLTMHTDDEDHQLSTARVGNNNASDMASCLPISSVRSTNEQQANSVLDDQCDSVGQVEEKVTFELVSRLSTIDPSLATGVGIINHLNKQTQEFKGTLKLNSVLDDQCDSVEQVEEKVTFEPVSRLSTIDPSLATGLGIINHLNKQNQEFKGRLKQDNQTDASLLDVRFVADRSCRVDLPLEDLLCSEPQPLSASPVDDLDQACDDELFSYEEVLGSANAHTALIDRGSDYSVFEELSQLDLVDSGLSAGSCIEHIERLGIVCDLLSFEEGAVSSAMDAPTMTDSMEGVVVGTDPAGKYADGSLSSQRD